MSRASVASAGQAGAGEREEGDEAMEEERVRRRNAEILEVVSGARSGATMVEVRGHGWVTPERAEEISEERRAQRLAEAAVRRRAGAEAAARFAPILERAEAMCREEAARAAGGRERAERAAAEARATTWWNEWRPSRTEQGRRSTWWTSGDWRAPREARGWRWGER